MKKERGLLREPLRKNPSGPGKKTIQNAKKRVGDRGRKKGGGYRGERQKRVKWARSIGKSGQSLGKTDRKKGGGGKIEINRNTYIQVHNKRRSLHQGIYRDNENTPPSPRPHEQERGGRSCILSITGE